MPSVLFVCLGNICRSPMAEAVFNSILMEKQLTQQFTVDSAGTSNYHVGDVPDSRSVKCCASHGVSVQHRGRQVEDADFTRFEYILCMDESNRRDLMEMKPRKGTATIKLLGEYDPQGERIIADPYYGGSEGFEHNFQQCQRACRAFLTSLGFP